MNFIKSIWNRITSFFGNLFGSKNDTVKVEAPTVTATTKAAETIAATEDQAAKAARMEALAEVFNRVMQLAAFRNYDRAEAIAAYEAGDEQTLARIERAMKARTYKAPSKSKVAKMRKPLSTVAA